MTLLSDGTVLVAGGASGPNPFGPYPTAAERYDPVANSWSPAGALSVGRTLAAATRLANGKVLVAGGFRGPFVEASAELYDPGSTSWSPAGSMFQARRNFTATLLGNGKVLVTGGRTTPTGVLQAAELYDPGSNSWSPAAPMSARREGHTATLLSNGKVLVVGATAEVYDPGSNSWSPTGPLSYAPPIGHTATRLGNGKVLVAGRIPTGTSAQLYDPGSNSWSPAASMGTARGHFTATLLNNGKVLAAGGSSSGGPTATAELYEAQAASPPADGNHLVTANRVEQQVDLAAGQTRTVTLGCPVSSAIMTDGSARVDAVDQGTGTLASVEVRHASSSAVGSYTFTLVNHATGRAQTKVFGTCLNARTNTVQGHSHAITTTGPVTQAVTWAAGSQTATLSCAAGQVAIAPGFELTSGTALPRRSEPADTAWTFAFTGAATAKLSVRCLDTKVAAELGHSHKLQLRHVARTVTAPAHSTHSYSVSCGDLEKGIVASYDLPAGVLLLGHDPQPKIRVFKLANTTGSNLAAKLDLTCLGDRTGSRIT